METRIILVRHGQSLGNAMNIYLGHTDLNLSEEGMEQARKTAEHLKQEKIDVVYSSDLIRAHNTALPHAQMRGLSVIDSEELRELYIGKWEGKKVSDLIKNEYEDFVIKWQGEFGTFTPPGGESVFDASKRVYNKIISIARENPGKNVLIAMHAAVIRGFWCIISGVEPKNWAEAFPFPTNASYSEVCFDGDKFIPIMYSCDEHLK
jgi:broad specificity phosphatase PhoE